MVRLGNGVSVVFWREGSARTYARLARMGERGRGDILLCILVEPECPWTVQWVSRLGANEISTGRNRVRGVKGLHVRWAEERHGALLGVLRRNLGHCRWDRVPSLLFWGVVGSECAGGVWRVRVRWGNRGYRKGRGVCAARGPPVGYREKHRSLASAILSTWA